MPKKKHQPPKDDFGEKLFWFLAAAYLADSVGLASQNIKLKLAQLVKEYGVGESWQEQVEKSLELDTEFVRSVYNLCQAKGRTETQSLGFILRGLGCPEPDERLGEAMA